MLLPIRFCFSVAAAIEGLAYMNDKLYYTSLSSSTDDPALIGSVDLSSFDNPTTSPVVKLTAIDSPRAIVGHACSG